MVEILMTYASSESKRSHQVSLPRLDPKIEKVLKKEKLPQTRLHLKDFHKIIFRLEEL
jgi:hypothetical protein